MKKILVFACFFFAKNLLAQTIVQRDPEIEQMVKEISANSLNLFNTQILAAPMPRLVLVCVLKVFRVPKATNVLI